LEKRYLSEISLAEEFLKSAKNSLDFSMRTSANRLYFALEKAVVSYILFKGHEIPKTHQKIWEFSSTMLGEEYYSALRELYDLRMQADYGRISVFLELSLEVLKNKLVKVESLINNIRLRLKDDAPNEKDGKNNKIEGKGRVGSDGK